MNRSYSGFNRTLVFVIVAGFVHSTSNLKTCIALAQGTQTDYRRAMDLRNKYQALTVNIAERATWIDNTSRFWYRRSVRGAGDAYGQRLLYDFFVHHLLGVEPPDWNRMDKSLPAETPPVAQ